MKSTTKKPLVILNLILCASFLHAFAFANVNGQDVDRGPSIVNRQQVLPVVAPLLTPVSIKKPISNQMIITSFYNATRDINSPEQLNHSMLKTKMMLISEHNISEARIEQAFAGTMTPEERATVMSILSNDPTENGLLEAEKYLAEAQTLPTGLSWQSSKCDSRLRKEKAARILGLSAIAGIFSGLGLMIAGGKMENNAYNKRDQEIHDGILDMSQININVNRRYDNATTVYGVGALLLPLSAISGTVGILLVAIKNNGCGAKN